MPTTSRTIPLLVLSLLALPLTACKNECGGDLDKTCGDGDILDGTEECDNGQNNGPGKPCNADCEANTCGDGDILDGTEECDNGPDNADNAPCTSQCKKNPCGDGQQTPDEECDDGNNTPGDGCTDTCDIERYVFISSSTHTGKNDGLNGLANADSICQGLAAKHPALNDQNRTYMAWLSTDDGPATRFPDSVTTAQGPFKLPTDQIIASSWKDLTDGTLSHPINVTDKYEMVGQVTVWANTKTDGTPLYPRRL